MMHACLHRSMSAYRRATTSATRVVSLHLAGASAEGLNFWDRSAPGVQAEAYTAFKAGAKVWVRGKGGWMLAEGLILWDSSALEVQCGLSSGCHHARRGQGVGWVGVKRSICSLQQHLMTL